MKAKLFRLGIIIVFFILISGCFIYYIPYEEEPRTETYRPREVSQPYNRLEISFVYDYLAPYGLWVYLSPYGNVWIPRHVPYRWRPYTNGRWVWTEDGWLWISNFDWGWLTFHYGRWGWHERLGWFWVPGTIWAPAWVIWTWGELYIGWAPVPPEIDWIPGVGLAVMRVEPGPQAWVFVEGRYFLTPYLDRYLLPLERNRTILNFSVNKRSLAPKGERIFNEGVEPQIVSRWTKTEVKKYEIQEASRPGREILGSNTVSLPRPAILKSELAQPRQSLDPEKAQERLDQEKPREIRLQEFEVERKRLEKSQQEEESYFRRKMEEEKREAKDLSNQQEVERRYQIQLEQLKKEHQQEKTELDQRQEEEKKKLKGQPVRKKEEK